MNKDVNTNVGILIFLMSAIILVLADFVVIGHELYNKHSINDEKIIYKNVENNSDILTDQEAIAIGNELYDKVSLVFIHRGIDVEENVYYRKNTDGSFVVSTEFDNDNPAYEKLIINNVKELLTEKLFNEFCVMYDIFEYNGDYYRVGASRGRDESYIDTKLEVVSITENIISFKAISSYYVNLAERQNPDAQIEYKNNIFSLFKENNSWKVSEFTLAY